MRTLAIALLFVLNYSGWAQMKNYCHHDEIGTVQFFRHGYPLSFPAIEKSGTDSLELRFDDFITKSPVDLFYTITLCDYDWKPVDLNPTDYLEGFDDNMFEAYSQSINTTVSYMHYRLFIPNRDISVTQSGNYILGVFRDREKKDTVLMERFIVYDDIVTTELSINKFQSELLADRQELNAELSSGSLSSTDLSGKIKLMILQNSNWNTCKTYEKYTTNSKGNLSFNAPGQIVFNGRNEFRIFDMKSFKHFSERVSFIEYKAPYYNCYLKPDKLRGGKDYFTREDLNGSFFIDNTDTDDEDIIDADYALVHFTLETGYPLAADVFIDGAFSNWEYSDNYMDFNPETSNYEKTILLKQGLYNYRYVMKEYNSREITTDITEGDFYQTINNYIGIVYYRALGELYYKPIGITSFTIN
jgi:hypothetical protein